VIILDTNLWVFGTLGTRKEAVELLNEIETGEVNSVISAYMVQEALNAFDRTPGLNSSERDEFKTLFLTRLSRMTGLLEAPSSRDVSALLLEERRSNVQTQLLARILDVQAKDVPVLVLAFEHEDREPTILTNDADFAAFTPDDHSLSRLSIAHV
jgi:predicted nucleic acid-binding protein